MKVIYFDQDCKENFEEYAKIEAFNKKAEKFSNFIEKTAIAACVGTSVMAIIILMLLVAL